MKLEILAVEPDPFKAISEARQRLVRRFDEIPLKAVGSNVILREVKADVSFLLVEAKAQGKSPYRIGEVQSLGDQWTMDRVWYPPIPQQRRTPLLDGSWDKDWKPEVISEKPRLRPPIWTEEHARRVSLVKPGDLVVYINARTYDTFTWNGEDFLLYPGCWLQAVITDTFLANNPDFRRFDHAEL